MRNGFYIVYLAIARKPSSGVAFIEDGRFRGGDASIYFDGTISAQDGQIRAAITATQYIFTDPPSPPVLGLNEAHAILNGRGSYGQAAIFGQIEESPSFSFEMKLLKLKD